MKSAMLVFSVIAAAITLAIPCAFAQNPALEDTALNTAPALHANGFGGSSSYVTVSPRPLGATRSYRPFSGFGLATRVGFAGTGFDVATPARSFLSSSQRGPSRKD